MEIRRLRNTATTIYFPMIEAKKTDFEPAWTPASGDVTYIKDGINGGNTASLPAHVNKGIYELDIAAGEIDGEITVIVLVDSAVKDVEDQSIIIATYGDDSSAHPLNILADYILRRSLASADASSHGDAVIFRSLLGGLRKLVNRVYRSGSNLITCEEDDSTAAGTQVMTTSAAAESITDLDTT